MEKYKGTVHEDLFGRTKVNLHGNQGTNMTLTLQPMISSWLVFAAVALGLGEVFLFLDSYKDVLMQILRWAFILFPVLMLVLSVIELRTDFQDRFMLSVFVCLTSTVGICITEWMTAYEGPAIYNYIGVSMPLLVLSILLGIICRNQYMKGDWQMALHLSYVEITATIITYSVLFLFLLLESVISNDCNSAFDTFFYAAIMMPLTVIINAVIFLFSGFLATLPFRLLTKGCN